MQHTEIDLKSLVRTIPDYPKPGIMFRDITTLISHSKGFSETICRISHHYDNQSVDAIAGIEARGFIIGAAVANRMGKGFIPIRKKGKLPWKVIQQSYELEYGSDSIEIHQDAISPKQRVLLVDDLIATGGTAEAAVRLLTCVGASIVGAAFIVDLPDLGGMARLNNLGINSYAVMGFKGH